MSKKEEEIMEEKAHEKNEGVGEAFEAPDVAEESDDEQITALAADEEIEG